MIRTMAIVGTGLIGTSIALAATRRGVTVYLLDQEELAARTAAALGAGRTEPPVEPVELSVLAVPPSRVGPVLREQQSCGLALSYTDVASVKSAPERAVLNDAPNPSDYVGGHPLAGRELSGPLAARADLFQGRPWVLTPSHLTSTTTVDRVRELIALCGATPVMMPSAVHDDTVALTSHTPHVLASLMAARLRGCLADASLLSGQGLRDVTRIAGGDSRLWSDIVQANAAAVARVLKDLHGDLSRLLTALDDLADPYGPDRARSMQTVVDLLDRGIAGLREIPRARPDTSTRDARFRVAIMDRPGDLARLLSVTAEFGVGAEDVAVSTGPDTGLVVRCAVAPPMAELLIAKLRAEGWQVSPDTGGSPVPLALPSGPQTRG